jgi:sRNA-binding carbon storage regulator CsrA
MLILTFRPGQHFDMTALQDIPKGTRIEVHAMGVIGNQMRIGFDAPLSIRIDRSRITEKRRREEQPEKVDGNVA